MRRCHSRVRKRSSGTLKLLNWPGWNELAVAGNIRRQNGRQPLPHPSIALSKIVGFEVSPSPKDRRCSFHQAVDRPADEDKPGFGAKLASLFGRAKKG